MQINTSPTQSNEEKNKYQGSFAATDSLFPLAMSTCGEAGSDVYALNMEFATRRVEHRSEIHSNESQDLAEGSEVARLRRRLFFVLEQALLFRWRHHLCRQGMAFAAPRQLHSQNPVTVQANYTERVTRSERQKGANGNGNGNRNGDGNGDEAEVEAEREQGWMRVSECRTGTGTGAGTGAETRERVQGGSVDGNGDGNEGCNGDGNGGGNGDGSGSEDGSEDGKGNENGEGRVGGGGELWFLPHQEKTEYKTRHCHFARDIISVDRRWCLQGVNSFGRKTWRLPDDVVTREEQGTRDGKEETATGTRTRVGTGTRASTGMSTRTGIGARTGTGTGTRIEMRAEQKVGTFEVVIEVGRKALQGGMTPTSNQQPQHQDPTPQ